MSKSRGQRSAKTGVLIAIIVVLSIILCVLIAATFFVTNTLNKIPKADQLDIMSQEEIESVLYEEPEETEPGFTGEVIAPEDVVMPEKPVEVVQTGDDIISILLVGQDTKNMSIRSRTDSMILCTINKTTKTLTMTSFLRDMYVKIPGWRDQRINVAYVLGGFETLYDSLEYNFGVQVEQGVAVNFASFEKVIDAVGGVDVELTSREANHLNAQNYTWGLVEGVNTLNGEAALAYARIRKIDSDFARTNRQRTVITALLKKAKSLPLTDLYALVGELIPMVVTDMDNAQIVSLAMEIAPLLQDLTIVSQRIPVDDGYRSAWVDGMAVLLPDLETNRQFLIDTIGEE